MERRETAGPEAGSTSTILIVDDHPELLLMMKAMLSRPFRGVLTAASGPAAMDVLRSTPQVDLVISEADLPGEKSCELIEAVRHSFPSTAVMLTSAYAETELDPAIPCVPKPFTVETLTKRVEEVLAVTRERAEELSETLARFRSEVERHRERLGEFVSLRREIRQNISRTRQLRSEWLLRRNRQLRPTVLVVEDDAAFRYAVSRFLSKSGLTVLPASSRAGALQLWRNHHVAIQALVTDLQGVDGLELAAEVKAESPDTPVVFMTGSDASLPGPSLRKPFEMGDLLQVIRKALAKPGT